MSPTRSTPRTPDCQPIATQPGWRVVRKYSDDASGATTERPEPKKAMAAAEKCWFDVLLVYRVDRFSRNLRDMVVLPDDLDEAGVVFRSATEPFDTSTPMGRMLVQMRGMFAQFERDTIIDRVIAGMEREAATEMEGENAPSDIASPRPRTSS
ncbi:recombinase family protein [Nocardia farcinica]